MTDPKEIRNAFKKYFVNVKPNLAAKIPINEHTYKSYLKQRNIVTESYRKWDRHRNQGLNCKKSSGHDDIVPKAVKNRWIHCKTTNLYFNFFFIVTGIILGTFKLGIVAPVYKGFKL